MSDVISEVMPAPTTIAPDEVIDFTVEFPYTGEGYATLTMLGQVWEIEF